MSPDFCCMTKILTVKLSCMYKEHRIITYSCYIYICIELLFISVWLDFSDKLLGYSKPLLHCPREISKQFLLPLNVQYIAASDCSQILNHSTGNFLTHEIIEHIVELRHSRFLRIINFFSILFIVLSKLLGQKWHQIPQTETEKKMIGAIKYKIFCWHDNILGPSLH